MKSYRGYKRKIDRLLKPDNQRDLCRLHPCYGCPMYRLTGKGLYCPIPRCIKKAVIHAMGGEKKMIISAWKQQTAHNRVLLWKCRNRVLGSKK